MNKKLLNRVGNYAEWMYMCYKNTFLKETDRNYCMQAFQFYSTVYIEFAT